MHLVTNHNATNSIQAHNLNREPFLGLDNALKAASCSSVHKFSCQRGDASYSNTRLHYDAMYSTGATHRCVHKAAPKYNANCSLENNICVTVQMETLCTSRYRCGTVRTRRLHNCIRKYSMYRTGTVPAWLSNGKSVRQHLNSRCRRYRAGRASFRERSALPTNATGQF